METCTHARACVRACTRAWCVRVRVCKPHRCALHAPHNIQSCAIKVQFSGNDNIVPSLVYDCCGPAVLNVGCKADAPSCPALVSSLDERASAQFSLFILLTTFGVSAAVVAIVSVGCACRRRRKDGVFEPLVDADMEAHIEQLEQRSSHMVLVSAVLALVDKFSEVKLVLHFFDAKLYMNGYAFLTTIGLSLAVNLVLIFCFLLRHAGEEFLPHMQRHRGVVSAIFTLSLLKFDVCFSPGLSVGLHPSQHQSSKQAETG